MHTKTAHFTHTKTAHFTETVDRPEGAGDGEKLPYFCYYYNYHYHY